MSLSGVFSVLPTPFSASGDFDPGSLGKVIDLFIADGVNGFTALGVTSEVSRLTDAERDTVLDAVLKRVNGRVPVVAGTTADGLRTCIDYTKRAKAAGAAAVMISPPRMLKINSDAVAKHFAEGGKGALEVAKEVVRLCELPNNFRYVYESEQTLWDKMKTIATQIYGALDIVADSKIRGQIKALQEAGYGHYPVCVAKTQYSFSTDPKLRGAPTGHVVNIREVRLAAGAEFVVMICGDIMTMPGLPKVPASDHIDVDENGKIVGLF